MRSHDLNRLLDKPGPGADKLKVPKQIYVFDFPVEKPDEGSRRENCRDKETLLPPSSQNPTRSR